MTQRYFNVPLYMWILFILSSFIFIFFPHIDIAVSDLFFNDGKFIAKDTLVERFFYRSIKPVLITVILFGLGVFTYNLVTKKNLFNINKRVIIYSFLVLSIAPGLIVNSLLKQNWGRARPHQIVHYGGDKEFSAAFIPSDQKGYSFSSGHVAAAFSLVGLALLTQRKRKFWIALTITYAVLMSIARVSAGGHFFSDVITSFFIVYITTQILYGYLIQNKTITDKGL